MLHHVFSISCKFVLSKLSKKELVIWEDIAIYLVCSVLEVSRFIDGIRVSVLAVYERF